MSSRIIVKNLPKRYSEERMKSHFSEKGTVTDVKIMKTLQGDSRKFGFVGFKSEKEAKTAMKYFNGTFIDTSKIIVEMAKPIGDPQIPRAWSAYTKRKELAEEREKRDREILGLDSDATQSSNNVSKQTETNTSVLQTLYEETVAQNASDPKFQEFLQVMAPRAKSKTWANDDVNLLNERERRVVSNAISLYKKDSSLKKNSGKESSLNSKKVKAKVLSVPNRKPGGESLTVSKTHITFEADDDADAASDEQQENNENDSDFDVNSGSTTKQNDNLPVSFASLSSDLDWLRSRIKPIEPNTSSDKIEKSNDKSDDNKEKTEKGSTDTPKEDSKDDSSQDITDKIKYSLLEKEREREENIRKISDSGRLFVRNLPYDSSESSLRTYFEKFGPLSEIHMPIDRESKKPKGFAYILYLLPEHAVKAYKNSDHQFFQGRHLHILPANDKPNSTDSSNFESNGLNSGKSIKKQRDENKKKNAGNDFNWNSLYMSADAVADSIAERLQIDKMDLLSSESGSPAVRLALAETHIISETKKFFELNGITLDSFDNGKKSRSNTVILVKNIPFSVGKLADYSQIASEDSGEKSSAAKNIENEIRSLFGVHGSLGRVLVPPARTIAIVEFLEPSEARTAFRYLAYKRFGDAPLYLEWAPEKLFRLPYDPSMASSESVIQLPSSADSKSKISTDDIFEASKPTEDADDTSSNSQSGSVLFVKNLNFATTDESLQNAFSSSDGFKAAVVKFRTRKSSNGSSEKLSMGFGFVEFDSPYYAKLALATLKDSTVLDGHKLEIKMSDKSSATGSSSNSAKNSNKPLIQKPASNKLVVKNIPFEATKADLRQLFGSYAQLKSIRLPNKFSGGHRGFCFLEFLTNQEAANCLEQVGTSSHLYGRRLVVKWADDEPGLDGSLAGEEDNDDSDNDDLKQGALEKLRKKSTRKFLNSVSGSQNMGNKEKKIRLE
ncbi:Multiple RNA-binding domain-containing protein 1 [Smittium culicis]|uniref:Multiple RNA-binding domain-containing protein 1 n=1 Tax=Smittium culicis TaxID=133412 RepID=A0A1R1YHX8_9FUNG|nr:Multiple RNA-binding domain-containing protein 1 [Smittium culicis]